jgi:hypothetical protein
VNHYDELSTLGQKHLATEMNIEPLYQAETEISVFFGPPMH